jgi:RNA polymerase sigma-70 factor (ECF subfamily)
MKENRDQEIIRLYSQSPARAAEEADAVYGYECRRLARHILDRERETEACVRFALESATEAAACQALTHVGLYLLRATRKAALETFFTRLDAKRGDSMFLRVMDQLSTCVTLRDEPFGVNEAEALRLGGAVSAFLAKQNAEARDLFACRFFYGDPVSEIAERFGLSVKQTYTRVIKLRRKLAAYLEAAGLGSVSCPETLALSVNYLDDAILLAARKTRKRLRRLIPVAVTAACVALIAVSFPYLREVVNTDLVLRDRNWRDETDAAGDAEAAVKPDPSEILPVGSSVTLGGSTLTLDEITDTAATYTLVKTDSTPLYAAVYDRMGDALASTEEGYKVDGVLIRHGTLRIYVNGSEERLTTLPKAPGTYTVVVDFTAIRNGTYPMEEYMAFYAYIGEKASPRRVIFGLDVPSAESDTVAETEE